MPRKFSFTTNYAERTLRIITKNHFIIEIIITSLFTLFCQCLVVNVQKWKGLVLHQIQIKQGNIPLLPSKSINFNIRTPSVCKKQGVSFFRRLRRAMWPNFNITFIQKMGRKRIKGTKYNRVTKQQKYVFLKLCITEKQSIHEAAYNAGIHYSTAKTILFFHKKQYKNYSTYIVEDPNPNPVNPNLLQATWKDIPIDVDQERSDPCRIQLVVNSKKKMLEQRMRNRDKTDSTSDGKASDPLGVKLEYDDFQFVTQLRKNSSGRQEQTFLGAIKKQESEQVPNFECPQNFFY